MPVQIANPQVVAKIEELGRLTGLGKTAAVEKALDRMLAEIRSPAAPSPWAGLEAILGQIHRLAPRPDAFEAVEYDGNGLPK